MKVAIGSDHAGFALKQFVVAEVQRLGHEAIDCGVHNTQRADFPDYAEIVGRALQNQEAERGILLCGSGVGVCIAANKMRGVRASITHDTYSAHQGVEHDGMNVMCLGGKIIGESLAGELIAAYLAAEFQSEDRFIRRVNKINRIEESSRTSEE